MPPENNQNTPVAPSVLPSNVIATGPTRPKIDVDKMTDSPVPQSSSPSNPTPIPTVDEGPKIKLAPVPLPQRMAELRDSLMKKYPKSSVTVRLDITNAADSGQFSIYCSGLHESFHGCLGHFPTIVDASNAVKTEVEKDV